MIIIRVDHDKREQASCADQFGVSANCAVCPRMYWNALQMAQQVMDWLKEELQLVGQGIKDREKELMAATEERDSANSAIIKKGIDWLVARQERLDGLLFTLMQAQLVSPAGEVLAAAPR